MSSHLAANNIQPIINNDHDMNFNIGIRDDTQEGIVTQFRVKCMYLFYYPIMITCKKWKINRSSV